MYKFLLAGVLVLVSAAILSAQHHGLTGGFALRNYAAVDGLPQSQVNSIVEDSNGYLWMATFGGGLARFDGQDFKVYTTLDGLLSNIIFHLTIDDQKNLWIVHPRGITRFDGVTFKTFQASGELSKMKMVRKAFVFHDTTFIISSPGVLGKIYNDSVFYWSKEYEKDKLIWRIHQLRNGNLCFFLNDGRVVLKTAKGNAEIGFIPRTSRISSIYNHGDEMRMILYSIDRSVTTYALRGNYLAAVPDAVKGNVLFFDEATKTYWLQGEEAVYTIREGASEQPVEVVKDVHVNQVLADREGNSWLASNGSGLFKYFYQDFSKCSSENMRGVMSIMKDTENTMWIGTMGKGLWRMKQGKINSYQEKDSYRNSINCMAEAPDGTIWIGTPGGLGKYDKVHDTFSWYTPQQGLSGYSVLGLTFDEKEKLWVGTPSGLNYFDGKEIRHYTTEQGLLTNTVSALYYSKKVKTLFVGNEFGINTISNGEVKRLPIRGFENTTVLSINPYQDSLLLFGSGGAGFAVYNPKTSATHFITTHNGLISDFIYFITADKKNNVWVGTEKGISKIILNKKFEIVENLHFDHDNGLEGVETNQNAFYIDGKDAIFGLIDGLYEYNNLKTTGQHSFGLHLTNVDIFYGEEPARNYADSLTGFFKLPYKPVFPSDKNHITFSFNRVDKRYPKSVRFKYMLKNYDKGWSKPAASKQVTYSNLPPGNYEFQVMATNKQGSWSQVKLSYPFVVKAPFYQTATFAIIVVLLLLGLIIFIAYLRVRQKVEKAMMLERIRIDEQENLRKEIARDFHDEMGNQLTRIINYVSLLKLNGSIKSTNGNGISHGSPQQADLYTKVENSAKYLYNGTRDFIWSIDPGNDELSKLFIHVRDFGEKLFEEKDIRFRANNSVREKVKLPYGFSREVNLILKEVMTNTFKYSEARNATLSLQRSGLGFELDFEDDGIGFDLSETGKSNGLKNIRERADKVQAVLRIHSKEGSGTKISLSFQFTKKQHYGTTV